MKLKYKHVHFSKLFTKKGKHRYYCFKNSPNDVIGLVRWSTLLDQYIYQPYPDNTYTSEYLNEIAAFITNLKHL